MDTNNEKTIAELIQKLSNTVLDCLKRKNGDDTCYIDEDSGESFEEYWHAIMAVCFKKHIDISTIDFEDCFVKANKNAAKQYVFEKEKKVTDILEEFINRCSWTPDNCKKKITIPYVMNTDKYTQKRKSLNNWESIEAKIIEYEKNFLAVLKSRISDYNFQDYYTKVDGDTRHSKGSPDMIKYVIDGLIKDGFIKNNADVLQFMKDYAIGIDCSGFVTRAVATVLEKLEVGKERQFLTIGRYSNKKYLKPDCACMASDGFIASKDIETIEYIKKENEKKKEKKELTQNYKITGDDILSKVRVGDIICTIKDHYHVKIIYKIDRDDKGYPEKLYFAESSSVGQKGVTKSDSEKIPVNYTVVRPYYMDIYYDGKYGTHLK